MHYVVQAVRGRPSALDYDDPIEIKVEAASETDGHQCVFFNRGAIPSQAFADRFGNEGPTDDEKNDPYNDKVKWLSRGLLEAALAFIGQAQEAHHELRVCAYEFYYPPILSALKQAAARGAQIRVVFDGGDERRDGSINHSSISQENLRIVEAFGLDDQDRISLHPRTLYGGIRHNKFMVLLDLERPIETWTGSTNFTSSGFLGESNVGHWIRDESVANSYNVYWAALAQIPELGLSKSILCRSGLILGGSKALSRRYFRLADRA